ncbi:MAG TPA: hypothetical protein VKE51_09685 [Vicinamibacterales bacterium]|nr:hypothetical protein [Vicinamibacterales bacterium]
MARHRLLSTTALAFLAVSVARPALAGPPLLCEPFAIGSARSLPMGSGSWRAMDPKYDVSHLVEDTLAILVPSTAINVRMETLRRAAIYAAEHPEMSAPLLNALEDRSKAKAYWAAFDYGYLVEALREAAPIFKSAAVTP